MPAGRPTGSVHYGPEIKEEILERLSCGESLRTICKDEHMPHNSLVMKWCHTDEEFFQQYTKARQLQAWGYADEIMDIADDGRNDYIERLDENGEPTGGYVLNSEYYNRSRLRVDTRKWYLSKVLPKTFGDKAVPIGSGGVIVNLVDVSKMNIPRPKEIEG